MVADPPQKLYGDGEQDPFDETPSDIRVMAGALKVLVQGSINDLMAKRHESERPTDDE